jgi:hypothetical protein
LAGALPAFLLASRLSTIVSRIVAIRTRDTSCRAGGVWALAQPEAGKMVQRAATEAKDFN